ncbi:hypothetical protein Q7P37_000365 [Cladosporium fusiforme]
MAFPASHKRKASDGAEPSSSRVPACPVTSLITQTRQTDPEGPRRHYQDITISDSARSHLGDTHIQAGTVNYNQSPRSAGHTDDDKRWADFKKSLAFSRMEFRRSAIDPAYGDTCRWILDTESYLNWRDEALRSEHHGFLWIKGKPGVGKSTIMKFLLNHAQNNMREYTVLSFFFNARGSSLETSAQGLYRSLLLQLLDALPDLRHVLKIPYGVPQSTTQELSWAVETVQDLFREALAQAGQQRVVLFIDALDEGDQEDVRSMVQYMAGLVTAARCRNMPLDVCFASRHYPRITTPFCEELIVEQQKQHKDDIQNVVFGILTTAFKAGRDELVHKIVSKSQDVFLWVILVVHLLNEKSDQGFRVAQLMEILQKIPAGLTELLDAILAAGASDRHVLPALQWVLFSENDEEFDLPLSNIASFYFAIILGAGELDSAAWDSEEVDRQTMERFILQATKGLVEVVSEDVGIGTELVTVQFIHECVREHLLGGGLTKIFPSLENDVKANSHARLAEWCQTYIQLIRPEDLGASGIARMNPSRKDAEEQRSRINTVFPMMLYSRNYIFMHMEAAFAAGVWDLKHLETFPLRNYISISHALTVSADIMDYLMPSTTLLHLLISDGRLKLARRVMNDCRMRSDPNHENTVDVRMETVDPLCASILASLDYQGLEEGYTLLTLALNCLNTGEFEVDEPLIQLILECGADINLRDGRNLSPLETVSERGNITWMRVLMQYGADINLPGGKHGSAVNAAAVWGNTDAVEYLLQRKANVNLLGGEHGSALGAAAYRGNIKLARLLLAHGANINESHHGYNIALREARRLPPIRPWLETPQKTAEVVDRIVRFVLDHGASEPGRRPNFMQVDPSCTYLSPITTLINTAHDC